MKFRRRKDLSTQTRIQIALTAYVYQGIYGKITELAHTYQCSRLFVYKQLWIFCFFLKHTFATFEEDNLSSHDPSELHKLILLLRLEGKVSIPSIAVILEEMEYSRTSTGYICELLQHVGKALSPNLSEVPSYSLMINSDEIFSGSQPILVTIEPHSMAILRMELANSRTGDDWQQHWVSLKQTGLEFSGLCSDQGKGIIKGFTQFDSKLPYFPDHFHLFRALLRQIKNGVFNEAIKAMEERERLLSSKNIKAEDQAITIYDNHHYLLQCILEVLPFLNDRGEFQDPEVVRDTLETALELIIEMECSKTKEIALKLLSDLNKNLAYLRVAQQVKLGLSAIITEPEFLKAFCLAWTHQRKVALTSGKQRRYHLEENKFWLEYLEVELGVNYSEFKELSFRWLDSIPRASSLVEAVNSLLRPYLNVIKGQLTQPLLNLILYYHNHRPFLGGKRKGKAPLENLLGKPLESYGINGLIPIG